MTRCATPKCKFTPQPGKKLCANCSREILAKKGNPRENMIMTEYDMRRTAQS